MYTDVFDPVKEGEEECYYSLLSFFIINQLDPLIFNMSPSKVYIESAESAIGILGTTKDVYGKIIDKKELYI